MLHNINNDLTGHQSAHALTGAAQADAQAEGHNQSASGFMYNPCYEALLNTAKDYGTYCDIRYDASLQNLSFYVTNVRSLVPKLSGIWAKRIKIPPHHASQWTTAMLSPMINHKLVELIEWYGVSSLSGGVIFRFEPEVAEQLAGRIRQLKLLSMGNDAVSTYLSDVERTLSDPASKEEPDAPDLFGYSQTGPKVYGTFDLSPILTERMLESAKQSAQHPAAKPQSSFLEF